MRIRRALIPLVPLMLAGLLLAGCGDTSEETPAGTASSAAPAGNGVAGLDPNAIVDKAVAALGAAASYSAKGELINNGEKFGVDLKRAGDDFVATLTLGDTRIELLSVAGQRYVRPDTAFWKQLAGEAGSTTAALTGNKWTKLTDSKEDAYFHLFFNRLSPEALIKLALGTYTKGDAKTINGVDAIGVVESGAEGGILYVATTGEPYPLVLQGPASSGGQIAFGDFGTRLDGIEAPAAAEVVDGKLGQ